MCTYWDYLLCAYTCTIYLPNLYYSNVSLSLGGMLMERLAVSPHSVQILGLNLAVVCVVCVLPCGCVCFLKAQLKTCKIRTTY